MKISLQRCLWVLISVFLLLLVLSCLPGKHLPGVKALDPNGDPDGDGYRGKFSQLNEWNFTNLEEFQNGTYIDDPDSDDDGCWDGWELHWKFNPRDADDGDDDPDNDGYTNYQEFLADTNPLDTGDTDGDGMPDKWENDNGFDPDEPMDAGEDADNDGLTNLEEFQRSTRPRNPDTDDDGMPDGWEVDNNLDPRVSNGDVDTDNGGVSNFGEYLNETNPLDPADDLGEQGNRGGGNGGYGIPEARQLIMDTGATRWSVKLVETFLEAEEADQFKRWQVMDSTSRFYRLYIQERAENILLENSEDYNRIYYLSLNVSSKSSELFPLPTPAPDSEVLYYYYNNTNGTTLEFYRDSADNLYMEPNQDENATLYLMLGTSDDYRKTDYLSGTWLLSDIPKEAKQEVPEMVSDTTVDLLDNDLFGTSLHDLHEEDDVVTIIESLVEYYGDDFSRINSDSDYDVPNPDQGDNLYRHITEGLVGAGRHRAFGFFITANSLGLPTRYVSNDVHAFVEIYIPFTSGYSAANWRLVDLEGYPIISETEPRPGDILNTGTQLFGDSWTRNVEKGDMMNAMGNIEDTSGNPLPYHPLKAIMNDSDEVVETGLFSADTNGDFYLLQNVPDSLMPGPATLTISSCNFSRYRESSLNFELDIYSEVRFADLSPSSAPNATTVYITGYLEDAGGLRQPGQELILFFEGDWQDNCTTEDDGFYNLSLPLNYAPGEYELRIKFPGSTYLFTDNFTKDFLVKEEAVTLSFSAVPSTVNSGSETTIYGNLSDKNGDPIPWADLGDMEIFIEGNPVDDLPAEDLIKPGETSFRFNITIPTSIQTGVRSLVLRYASPGTSIYPDGVAQSLITVRALATELRLASKIGQSDTEIFIEGELLSQGSGLFNETVAIYWDGSLVGSTQTDKDGRFRQSYNISDTERGSRLVEVRFAENLPYASTSNSTDYFIYMPVIMGLTPVSHPTLRLIRGEELQIDGELLNASGEAIVGYPVDVYINGDLNTTITSTENGFSFTYQTFLDQKLGVLDFLFVFESQDYFLEVQDNVTFEMGSNTSLDLSAYPGFPADPGSMDAGETLFIYGDLSDNAGNLLHNFTVIASFNGQDYQNISYNGSFAFDIPVPRSLSPLRYTVSITSPRNGYHLIGLDIFDIYVMHGSEIVMKGMELRRNESYSLKGELRSTQNTPIPDAQVELDIDGTVHLLTTDEDGLFSYHLDLPFNQELGPLPVTATFRTNELYHGNATNPLFEVWSHPELILEAGLRSTRENFIVAGRVLDDRGVPIQNRTVEIHIDTLGIHLSRNTGLNGYFTMNVSSIIGGENLPLGPVRVNASLPYNNTEEPYEKEARGCKTAYLFALLSLEELQIPPFVDHLESFSVTGRVEDEYGEPLEVNVRFTLAEEFWTGRTVNGVLTVKMVIARTIPSGEQQLSITTPDWEVDHVFAFHQNETLIIRQLTEIILFRNYAVRGEQHPVKGRLNSTENGPLVSRTVTLLFREEVYHATTDLEGNFTQYIHFPSDMLLGEHEISISFQGSEPGEGSMGYEDKNLVSSLFVLSRTGIVVNATEGHYTSIPFAGKVVDINQVASPEEATSLNLSVDLVFNGQLFQRIKLPATPTLETDVLGNCSYTIDYPGVELPEPADSIIHPGGYFLSSHHEGVLRSYGHLTPTFQMEDAVEITRELEIRAQIEHDYAQEHSTTETSHLILYLDEVKPEQAITSFFTNSIQFDWLVPASLEAGNHTLILDMDPFYAESEFYKATRNSFEFKVIQRSFLTIETYLDNSSLTIFGELRDTLGKLIDLSKDNVQLDLYVNGVYRDNVSDNPFEFPPLPTDSYYGELELTVRFNGSTFFLPTLEEINVIVGVETNIIIKVLPEPPFAFDDKFDLVIRVLDIHGGAVKQAPLRVSMIAVEETGEYFLTNITATTGTDGNYESSFKFKYEHPLRLEASFAEITKNGTVLYHGSNDKFTLGYVEKKQEVTPKEQLMVFVSNNFLLLMGLFLGLGFVYWKYKEIAVARKEWVARTTLEKQRHDMDLRELILRIYKEMQRLIRRRGITRAPYETVREFKTRALQKMGFSQQGVGHISDAFEQADYNKDEPSKEMGQKAYESLGTVREETEGDKESFLSGMIKSLTENLKKGK